MITVYVWNFRGTSVAWGHASMRVNGGSPPGEVYISWWPQGSGRSPKVPGVDQIYTVTAIRGRTYADDVRDEEQAPDHVIIFSGLDETAIKTWWADLLRNTHAQWSTLGQNCSTTVAHALASGYGEDLVTGFDGWLDTRNIVWKPDDVLSYALAVQTGIGRIGIWECGARDCPTHRRHDHRCVTGVWMCGRRVPPCPGHSGSNHSCTVGVAWHCGARDCRTHSAWRHRCATGVWICRRRIPQCPGHSSPRHHC